MPFNVVAARAMTALAADGGMRERRRGVAILCAADRLHLACVAVETARLYRASRHLTIRLITWGDVPSLLLRVIANWRLIKEAINTEKITTTPRSRSNEIVQFLFSIRG